MKIFLSLLFWLHFEPPKTPLALLSQCFSPFPRGVKSVNGYSKGSKNYYVVYRLSDGAFVRSQPLDRGPYRGDVRIDPAPRWNRTSDAILVPGIAHNKTRQLFVIHVLSSGESPSINAAK